IVQIDEGIARAVGLQFESFPEAIRAAALDGPIDIVVGIQDKGIDRKTCERKAVEDGKSPGVLRQLEDGTAAARTAQPCSPVKIAGVIERQAGVGIFAVASVGEAVENPFPPDAGLLR